MPNFLRVCVEDAAVDRRPVDTESVSPSNREIPGAKRLSDSELAPPGLQLPFGAGN
jgi:hypothetical protein